MFAKMGGPLLAAVAAATTAAAADTTAAPSTSMPSSAATTTSTPSYSVLTITVQALTTTFTPPPQCAESRLTMMSGPNYPIWINEPLPVPGKAHGECYPTEFMQGYASIANSSSSIAPFFKPLVCPEGWWVAQEWPNGYIACCNEGYNLTPPDTTVDPERPAYGGTCYSQFLVGQTANVTKYGTADVTGTGVFPATSSADAAYGHVMDGFKLGAVPVSATPSAGSDNDNKSGLSGGAIAGIVIGVIAGLSAIAGAVFLLFRRRPKQQQHGPGMEQPPTTANTSEHHQSYWHKDATSPSATEPSQDQTLSATNTGYTQQPQHELQSPEWHAELENTQRHGELPGNWHGNELRG